MWKIILRVVMAVSNDPKVRAWAKKKAEKVIGKIIDKAQNETHAVAVAADLYAPPDSK
jgi:hypothetical protein